MSILPQAISGMKWTGLSSLISILIQMIQIAILARFLSPDDFGLMALALVLIGLAQALSDGGISNAIIQNQDMKPSEYHSLYWFNIGLGCLVCALLNMFAMPIAMIFGRAELQDIIHVISVIFIIQSFGQQYRMVLQKHFEFNRLAMITIISKVIVFGVAVTLAMNNFGVYALVYAAIIDATIISVLLLLSGLKYHKPVLYFSWKNIQKYLSFGAYQTGERFINLLAGQSDKILIGYFLGASALGFYTLAWQLIIFPVQKINPILTQVMFPIYSKLQNQKDLMGQYFIKTIEILSCLTIPFFVFVGVFATPIVDLVYGDGWNLSAQIIPWLAAIGFIKVILNPIGSLFVALGRVDVTFKMNFIWAIVIGVILLATLIIVPELIMVPKVLLVLSSLFFILWFVMLHRYLPTQYKSYYMNSILFFALSLCASIALSFTVNIHIISLTILFATLYFAMLVLLKRTLVIEYYNGLKAGLEP
jgi:O-antigen/teichoic acid export membrane protein